MKITFISDTHNKHKQITHALTGGDVLIHAGDISSMGYEHEIAQFCKWFDKIDNYNHKIFIAGNHDWGFQDNVEEIMQIVNSYKTITYLQDDWVEIDGVKIYGSPWQPRFFNWAFNADRGEDIQQHWNKIPTDTDILITHGPAYGKVDKVVGHYDNLGCSDLRDTINIIKPKIHVCGHIHTGYGYVCNEHTHFFNAAVLNESYNYAHKPINIEWDKTTNQMTYLN
jgi:Icc-related predicted phosphoesterase